MEEERWELRTRREAAGLTLDAIGERMCVAKGHISNVERGLAGCSKEFMERYQGALKGLYYTTPLPNNAPRKARKEYNDRRGERFPLAPETMSFLATIAALTGEENLDTIARELFKAELRRLLEVT